MDFIKRGKHQGIVPMHRMFRKIMSFMLMFALVISSLILLPSKTFSAIDTTNLIGNIYSSNPSAPGELTGGVTPQNGQWQKYSYNFTATQSLTSISFLFRHDPSFFAFDDVSVKLNDGNANKDENARRHLSKTRENNTKATN